uniref:Uncharacterized protein n=1 Tax=Plectus sambesii TaxID=2011161 RepID=A0A914UWP8_9BILA
MCSTPAVWFDPSDLDVRSAFVPPATGESHNFLADDRDLHSMERSLLMLLDEFRSGQLRALREDTMAQMREVRAKQEQLTKLHFELYTDQRRLDAMHQLKPCVVDSIVNIYRSVTRNCRSINI